MILSILVGFWGTPAMVVDDVDVLKVWITRDRDEADTEDNNEVDTYKEVESMRGKDIYKLAMEEGN